MIPAFTLPYGPSFHYKTHTHAKTSLLPNSVIMQMVSICISVHKRILVIAICLFYAVKFVSLITNRDSQMHFVLDVLWACMHICSWKRLCSSLLRTGRLKNINLHLPEHSCLLWAFVGTSIYTSGVIFTPPQVFICTPDSV